MLAMRPDVKEIASGRWEHILADAGLPSEMMRRRMGPCPQCGGNTRFYMQSLTEGRGWCHVCGPLDGWAILMAHLRTDFAGAARWVRLWDGGKAVAVARQLPASAPKAAPTDDELRSKYEQLWQEGLPIKWGSDTPAARYLAWRVPGLGFVPDALREHPALDYWTMDDAERYKRLGTFPALLARVTAPTGELANIWRTYLSPTGDKAPVPDAKKAAGRFLAHGCAIRLGDPQNGRLGVAEGIEGALGAMLRGGPVTWACCNAPVMKSFVVPHELGIDVVTIYGDNDAPDHRGRRAGNETARSLRDRLKEEGRRAFVVMPASTSYDLNDLVKGQPPGQAPS